MFNTDSQQRYRYRPNVVFRVTPSSVSSGCNDPIQKFTTKVNKTVFQVTDTLFPSTTIDGILLSDSCTGDTTAGPEFIPTATAALKLIKARDPLRHRRLLDSLTTVRSLSSEAHANYQPQLRACHLNFPRFVCALKANMDESSQSFEKILVAELAQILIHESTHGYLRDRGIESGDEVWRRVERRCRREETLLSGKALQTTPGYAVCHAPV